MKAEKEKDQNTPVASSSTPTNGASRLKVDIESGFGKCMEKQEGIKNTEVDIYLRDGTERKDEKFDVLAMPIFTVASESAFSTSGRVIDKFRSSLTPKTAEALICTQDWLRSTPADVEDVQVNDQQLEDLNMKSKSSHNCGLRKTTSLGLQIDLKEFDWKGKQGWMIEYIKRNEGVVWRILCAAKDIVLGMFGDFIAYEVKFKAFSRNKDGGDDLFSDSSEVGIRLLSIFIVLRVFGILNVARKVVDYGGTFNEVFASIQTGTEVEAEKRMEVLAALRNIDHIHNQSLCLSAYVSNADDAILQGSECRVIQAAAQLGCLVLKVFLEFPFFFYYLGTRVGKDQ
ncbi:zinc finger BED domain-containing protein RICESLEEPER 2-like protein [Tanacetum coccineum]